MSANRITAIATLFIAIFAVGFVANRIYNSPTNQEARCLNLQNEQLNEGPSNYVLENMTEEEWKLAIGRITKICIEEARR